MTKLCIEYDVSIMNDVREPGVPLLVEVESPRPQNLGLTLVNSGSSILINCVKQGSIAERYVECTEKKDNKSRLQPKRFNEIFII